MGQYYNIIIREEGKSEIDAYNRTIDGEYTLAKLMEHSWYNNDMVNAICEKLYNNPSQIAWVGDYANEEGLDDLSLYEAAWGEKVVYKELHKSFFTLNRLYLVNHTKKQIIDCWGYLVDCLKSSKDSWVIHPLPLLVALGNGRGGGDYRCFNNDCVGCWAWDLIEIVEWEKAEELKKNDYHIIPMIFYEY